MLMDRILLFSIEAAVRCPVAGRSTLLITMGCISATRGDEPISFNKRATVQVGSRRHDLTPLPAIALKSPPKISAKYQP